MRNLFKFSLVFFVSAAGFIYAKLFGHEDLSLVCVCVAMVFMDFFGVFGKPLYRQ